MTPIPRSRRLLPPAPPTPDPTFISLDIETFSNVEKFADGRPTPPRPSRKEAAFFHPLRAIYQTPISPRDLLVSCSITLVSLPTSPGALPSRSDLASATPTTSFYFLLHDTTHRHLLLAWLQHATCIFGMNLPFDLSHLRTDPLFATALQGRQHLIDLSVLNYLHNELRPEKSLKNLGPVLHTHIYNSSTLRDRHPSPLHPSHRNYNCQDSHNTILAISELARRIHLDFPSTDKLSPSCLSFYSDVLWCCIHMTEAGIPLQVGLLEKLEQRMQRLSEAASKRAASRGLLLSGKGSNTSKEQLLTRLIDKCPDLLSEPLLGYTPIQHKIQFNEANRSLIRLHLPPNDPDLRLLDAIDTHGRAEKIISSFTYPLLRHNRNRPWNTTSILLPQPSSPSHNPAVFITYPIWYPVPSAVKDTSGDEGGTVQSRPAAKKPSFPTFPPAIQECQASRWHGGVLLKMDLSQNEMRAGALLSGEPFLLNAFLRGWDCHARTAADMWPPSAIFSRYPNLEGESIDKWRELSRGFKKREGQVGKRVNFAAFFRAGALKMAMSVLGDIGEALPLHMFQEMVNTRPARMPVLWQWQRTLIRECHGFSLYHHANTTIEIVDGDRIPPTATFIRYVPGNGYIHLPITGQSRWFMGGDKYDVNEIVNFPIQTTAANLLWFIQTALLRRLDCLLSTPRVLLYGNIYDAVAFDCRTPADADRVEATIRDVITAIATDGYWARLRDHYQQHVPLAYEITRSDR